MFTASIFSLFLRSLNLFAKFLLTLLLAKFLTDTDYGTYGLMTVTISLSLYLLGMDFYIFNTREILAKDKNERTFLIRDQLVFHGIGYLIICPILLVVFLFHFLEWKLVIYFYPILILEHLAQESYRLLITLSRPVMANLTLFFRGGIWVYAIILIGWVFPDTRSLNLVWIGWLIGLFLSIILAFSFFARLPWKHVWQKSIDYRWILNGIRRSLPFFVSSLSFLGVQFSDRYFIEIYHNRQMVGIYTFFAQISNMISVFVFAGIISFFYPKIIRAYERKEINLYKTLFKKMSLLSVSFAMILAILAIIGIPYLLILINKPTYTEYLSSFYFLLTSVFLLVLAELPHYALYIRKKDKLIFVSTLISLSVALMLNIVLVPHYNVVGAAIATAISMFILFILKISFAIKS